MGLPYIKHCVSFSHAETRVPGVIYNAVAVQKLLRASQMKHETETMRNGSTCMILLHLKTEPPGVVTTPCPDSCVDGVVLLLRQGSLGVCTRVWVCGSVCVHTDTCLSRSDNSRRFQRKVLCQPLLCQGGRRVVVVMAEGGVHALAGDRLLCMHSSFRCTRPRRRRRRTPPYTPATCAV